MRYIVSLIVLLLIGTQIIQQNGIFVTEKDFDNLGSDNKLERYRQWKKQYKNTDLLDLGAKNSQDDFRFQVWLENLELIERHNAADHSVILGLNQFADLTREEYGAIYLQEGQPIKTNKATSDKSSTPLKQGLQKASKMTILDWSIYGAVGRVQNQRQCNAGYAFASVDNAQSIHFLKTGKLLYFSQQQVIDCQTDGGCRGGNPDNSLQYIAANGLFEATDYYYRAESLTCIYDEALKKGYPLTKPIKKSVHIPNFSTAEIQNALNKNPVVTGIDGFSDVFRFYKGGVIQNSGAQINHYVLITGAVYDEEEQGYWIIKNSWGKDWGEQGFARVQYGESCGIGQAGYTGSD